MQSARWGVFARVQLPADNHSRQSLLSDPKGRVHHLDCNDRSTLRHDHNDFDFKANKYEHSYHHRYERDAGYKRDDDHDVYH